MALLPTEMSRRVAILDANLIVLFVTSMVPMDLFSSFKRARIFSKADVLVLNGLLRQFKSVATNAYVLAETSNLANELTGLKRDLWFNALASFASATAEIHVPTQEVADSPIVVRLGITDAALGALPDDYVLITADGPLFAYLSGLGKNVLNFNHFRFL